MLNDRTLLPVFNDPTFQRRLTEVARLTGPQRDLAFGKLDLDLARNGAPLVAIGYFVSHDFFSARTRCQTYGFYGVDLAALCLRQIRR